MRILPSDSCFLFVIKTNLRTYNFAREMCAYVTGEFGGCCVGDIEAEIFNDECPDGPQFGDIIATFNDEYGCERPVSVWGETGESIAIFFKQRPTPEQLCVLRNRSSKFRKFYNNNDNNIGVMRILGFYLSYYEVTRDESIEISW